MRVVCHFLFLLSRVNSRSTGKKKENYKNLCSSEPCLNGGNCTESGSSYTCSCPGDYTGDNCENDPCSWTPCMNSGTCTVVGSTYECACTEGYEGGRCEITPCHIAGGLKSDAKIADFEYFDLSDYDLTGTRVYFLFLLKICLLMKTLLSGYQGYQYLYSPDGSKAIAGPCLHGGICVNNPPSGYICLCWGLEGVHCEITPCTPEPCQNNGTCSFPNSNSYECTCADGYSGYNCQIGPCNDNPCQNGGLCQEFGAGFQCSCDGGFTGETCEIPAVSTTTAIATSTSVIATVSSTTSNAVSSTATSSITSSMISSTAAISSTSLASSTLASVSTTAQVSSSSIMIASTSTPSTSSILSTSAATSSFAVTTTVSLITTTPILSTSTAQFTSTTGSSTSSSVIQTTSSISLTTSDIPSSSTISQTSSIPSTTSQMPETTISSSLPPLVDWIIWRLGDDFPPEVINSLLGAYGCASRGFPDDPFAPSLGRPVDGIDKVLLRWKKCIRCAMSVEFDGRTEVPSYIWPESEICDMTGLEREICECDKHVATELLQFQDENGDLLATNSNFDEALCIRGPSDGEEGFGRDEFCCKKKHGAFQMYNAQRFCCEFESLHIAGSCVFDEGLQYRPELFL